MGSLPHFFRYWDPRKIDSVFFKIRINYLLLETLGLCVCYIFAVYYTRGEYETIQ